MAGFGIVDHCLRSGPRVLDRPAGDPGPGSYVVIDIQDSVTHVASDPLGNHVLYWGAGIVTNRLHLAAIVQGDLDDRAALATIHSNHMFCQQFGTSATPVAGIEIAHVGVGFSVNDAVRVTRDSVFSPATGVLRPSEYRDLIRMGADEVRANVSSILDGPYPVLCDLTGGQDSRVLLAALVSLGRTAEVVFHTDYSVTSTRMTATTNSALARKQADRDIARALVTRYGGAYGPRPEPSQRTVTSIDENTLDRRSQSFGSYHFVNASHFRTEWALFDEPIARMMGGSGELYRDYYQRFFSSVDPARSYDSGSVRNMLVENYNQRLPRRFLGLFVDDYVRTFNHLEGTTMGDRMDNHYLQFRNRYHFGMNLSRPGNVHPITPLVSPSLMAAARGLPPEEKRTGRVLFDVTQRLCEELPYLPYDTPKHGAWWDSDYHTPSRYDGSELELESCEPRRAPREAPASSDLSVEDFVSYCLAVSRESVSCIRAFDNEFSRLCTDDFADYLESDLIRRPTRLASWTSRLRSFADYSCLM